MSPLRTTPFGITSFFILIRFAALPQLVKFQYLAPCVPVGCHEDEHTVILGAVFLSVCDRDPSVLENLSYVLVAIEICDLDPLALGGQLKGGVDYGGEVVVGVLGGDEVTLTVNGRARVIVGAPEQNGLVLPQGEHGQNVAFLVEQEQLVGAVTVEILVGVADVQNVLISLNVPVSAMHTAGVEQIVVKAELLGGIDRHEMIVCAAPPFLVDKASDMRHHGGDRVQNGIVARAVKRGSVGMIALFCNGLEP